MKDAMSLFLLLTGVGICAVVASFVTSRSSVSAAETAVVNSTVNLTAPETPLIPPTNSVFAGGSATFKEASDSFLLA